MTINDVAKHAGVSNMTVSNVLNAKSARVSAATRDRVLQAIEELDYRVNLSARHLRRGRTGIVGLAVPDLTSGYYAELADRLARRFPALGYRLVLERTGGDLDAELDALAASHLEMYDGFVLSVAAGDERDLDAVRPSKPVVLIGEQAVSQAFDHVLMDNVGGADQATALLLRAGARRIVLLGGTSEGTESMRSLRTRGYVRAHRSAGVPVDADLVRDCGYSVHDGYREIQLLLQQGALFDAVFALTDSGAFGALRALAEARIAVPASVQVIGFDNLVAGRYNVPSLTTVEPGNDSMADAICAMLTERINGDVSQDEGRLVMPAAQVVERDTTLRS